MKSKNMPVFPNWFPYNDMMLDGHLKVDKWEGVKTRSWEWDYRGPVLLYNSLRTARPAVEVYKYTMNRSNHKMIIGVGKLIDVRLLTQKEALKMVCNFNNMSLAKVEAVLKRSGYYISELQEQAIYDFCDFGPYTAPYRIGFFFKNLKRFKEPIPFKWPPGPIKPIFTKIISGSKLHRQLKQSGF